MEAEQKLLENDVVETAEFEVVTQDNKKDPDYYYLDTPIEVDEIGRAHV